MSASNANLGKISFNERVYTASEVDELLSRKQDTVEIDGTPTEGSQNPVSSGGVAQYVEDGLAGLKSELEGYADSNDEATRAEIGSLRAYLSSALRYMGSVPSFDDLPEDADPGDVWNVAADDMNYAWALGSDDSGHWDPLGATLEGYPTRDELNDAITKLRGKTQATITAIGVLKGDGNGNVSAAVSGTDYLPPSHNTARDAHAALFATRPTMIQVGDGVWVFANDGEGFVISDGEVITLPASKTSFVESEYEGNRSLSFVYAPNVTEVQRYVFTGCGSLASVSLPAAMSIGDETFATCTSLTSISLPAAESIQYGVFYNCISLTSISLPSATSIGNSAFYDCNSLTTLDLLSFTTAQVEEQAATWGIVPPSGRSVTITCSDGDYTITGD